MGRLKRQRSLAANYRTANRNDGRVRSGKCVDREKRGGNRRVLQGCHPKFYAAGEEGNRNPNTRLADIRAGRISGCSIMGQGT
jgi:hypothetical protein